MNDILDHGAHVFSEEADALVRDIARFVPRYRLWDVVDWFSPPPPEQFTAQLRTIRDDLVRDAKARGWDV